MSFWLLSWIADDATAVIDPFRFKVSTPRP